MPYPCIRSKGGAFVVEHVLDTFLFMKYIYIVYFFQASRRSSTVPADPSRRLSATERKFGYADLLEEIDITRFLVEDETNADGDLSTVLVCCAVLPCMLCRKHTLSI